MVNITDLKMYVIKRENSEDYHTGYYGCCTPKLYTRPYATRTANALNRRLDTAIKNGPRKLDRNAQWVKKYHTEESMNAADQASAKGYEINVAKGKWIVAEVNLQVV